VGPLWHRFRSESEADVRLVDPPPPYLLALGCESAFCAVGRSFVREVFCWQRERGGPPTSRALAR
jgi:hypothetical protein